jgi:CubicO group peptidase (beta-lactamase class C family)
MATNHTAIHIENLTRDREEERKMRKVWFLITVLVITLLAGCGTPAVKPVQPTVEPAPTTTPVEVNEETWGKFEAELESLRQEMKIPGMSAAVVKDGQLVWARGLGYADVENHVPATPETPYHLASVTKTFAAVIVMQLVQEGKLSLDDPVARYGVNLPEGDAVLVRHLMSHTSEGIPGQRFQYNGNRYGLLSQVVQAATGRSLQEWLFERILHPLGMDDTAPSVAGCTGLPFAPTCERVCKALALPYQLDENLNFIPGYYYPGFGAAAGLISTVIDLAKFDAALDANTLVTAATKELMWMPTVSNSGQKLPYGLGWFTQSYRGTRLIWHYGQWPPSVSSLVLKIPDEGLTLIVLANTDVLSTPFQLGSGDIMTSLMALTFYKRFILMPRYGQPFPAIDWSGDDSTVLDDIKQVQDEAVRELLVKEFSSRRMVARYLVSAQQMAVPLAEKRSRARELAESIDPKILDAYVGEYEFEQFGEMVSVSRVQGRLYTEELGIGRVELLPLSERRFFMIADTEVLIEFTLNETNQVTGLVATKYGQSFTARRK